MFNRIPKVIEYRRIPGYIYKAYIYKLKGDKALQNIIPSFARKSEYGLSLLPLLKNPIHPASIFAWTTTEELPLLHIDAIEQPEFIDLLKETLSQAAKEEFTYLLSSRAKKVIDGYIPVVDERSMMVFGRTPDPDDTVGMCHVTNGILDLNSFQMMPTYRIISSLGIMSLPKILHELLIKRLSDL